MQKQLLATGLFCSSILFPLEATAQDFQQLYVFGDSLSDTGNFYNATGGTIPPSPPYNQGRFSNDRLWVEYLTADLGATSTNLAFAGATTGSSNTIPIPDALPIPPLPGLEQQITSFQATNPIANPDALYIISAGANDYLGGGAVDPSVPVSNLSGAIAMLAESGAENFLIVNLPDLGKLPGTNDSPQSSNLSTLTSLHNSELDTSLNDLSTSYGIDIYDLDVSSLFASAIAQPTKYGFTNVTDACLTDTGTCSNPNQYLFWDEIHPTDAAHKIIGEVASSRLEAEPVPEPSAGLGILALGGLGAGALLKRKYQDSLATAK